MNRFEDIFTSYVTWLVVTVSGGVIWLFRKVFTNEKRVHLLENEIRHREEQRKSERASDSKRIDALHKDLREVRDLITRNN